MKSDLAEQLEKFLFNLNRKMKEHCEKHTPRQNPSSVIGTISTHHKAKLTKLFRVDPNGSQSIYAFLCHQTGDLFKAASYAVPAKGARGNIYAPDMLAGCGPFGMEYKRGPNYSFDE